MSESENISEGQKKLKNIKQKIESRKDGGVTEEEKEQTRQDLLHLKDEIQKANPDDAGEIYADIIETWKELKNHLETEIATKQGFISRIALIRDRFNAFVKNGEWNEQKKQDIKKDIQEITDEIKTHKTYDLSEVSVQIEDIIRKVDAQRIGDVAKEGLIHIHTPFAHSKTEIISMIMSLSEHKESSNYKEKLTELQHNLESLLKNNIITHDEYEKLSSCLQDLLSGREINTDLSSLSTMQLERGKLILSNKRIFYVQRSDGDEKLRSIPLFSDYSGIQGAETRWLESFDSAKSLWNEKFLPINEKGSLIIYRINAGQHIDIKEWRENNKKPPYYKVNDPNNIVIPGMLPKRYIVIHGTAATGPSLTEYGAKQRYTFLVKRDGVVLQFFPAHLGYGSGLTNGKAQKRELDGENPFHELESPNHQGIAIEFECPLKKQSPYCVAGLTEEQKKSGKLLIDALKNHFDIPDSCVMSSADPVRIVHKDWHSKDDIKKKELIGGANLRDIHLNGSDGGVHADDFSDEDRAAVGALSICDAYRNFYMTEKFWGMPENTPKEKRKISQKVSPDYGRETVSENSDTIVRWILETGDNKEKPFIVVDKLSGSLCVFDKKGRLQLKSNALYGKNRGDIIPPIDEDGKVLPTPWKITPAGRFDAKSYDSEYGDAIKFLHVEDDEGGNNYLIHEVVNNPGQNRPARLKSSDPKDNKISSGCINVSAETITKIAPYFENEGVVYILPETTQGKSLFKGFRKLKIGHDEE